MDIRLILWFNGMVFTGACIEFQNKNRFNFAVYYYDEPVAHNRESEPTIRLFVDFFSNLPT